VLIIDLCEARECDLVSSSLWNNIITLVFKYLNHNCLTFFLMWLHLLDLCIIQSCHIPTWLMIVFGLEIMHLRCFALISYYSWIEEVLHYHKFNLDQQDFNSREFLDPSYWSICINKNSSWCQSGWHDHPPFWKGRQFTPWIWGSHSYGVLWPVSYWCWPVLISYLHFFSLLNKRIVLYC